jgi:competence protein ComQ
LELINTEMINKSLHSIINQHIKQQELKEQLLEYIDFHLKKGVPFGELLVLHHCMFNGRETEQIYKVAAAVELLILSFDMLDDFEDNDFEGKPWSEEPQLALNATTAFLFLCSMVIRNTDFKNKDRAISILLQYTLLSINGQHKDLLNICGSEADYIDMTIEKSGALVTLSCLVGTVLAVNDYPTEIEIYSKYIGLIGQINNDVADIKVWNEKNDLIKKKYSLPIIYLLNCNDTDLHFIHDYYAGKVEKGEIIEKQMLVTNKLIKTGAMAYTEVIKKIYQNKVIKELKKLNVERRYFELLKKYIY